MRLHQQGRDAGHMGHGHRGAGQVLEALAAHAVGDLRRLRAEDVDARGRDVRLEDLGQRQVRTARGLGVDDVARVRAGHGQALVERRLHGIAGAQAYREKVPVRLPIITAGIVTLPRSPVMVRSSAVSP